MHGKRPLSARRAAVPALAVLAVALASCADSSASDGLPGGAPAPDAAFPRDPSGLAGTLAGASRSLDEAIDSWLSDPETKAGPTPPEVTLRALYQQRLYLFVTERPRLAASVLRRLRGEVAAEARDILSARRSLKRLTPPTRRRRFRTAEPLPAATLLRYYRKAQRRFGVAWPVLAAVNFVETAFNRIRNSSTAGAQGPMQFIPSTWRAYGMGGDVRDPHDAILGAANYLRASGAPRDYRRALYAYNPSLDYVNAVLRYVRRIRSDRRAYYAFHAWQLYVRTPSGLRRLTGP
ncbi:MAG TPA: lytic transglycosylase domain-containing protein [Thermoleophilaceae bacterium]|nr:lytic transglycosylase domain-containing protein [Thermoleophilaceae bacterium]